MYVGIYVCVFNLIPSINISVFMSILCYFYYYSSVVQHKISNEGILRSSFIFQSCFIYLGFFFPYEVDSFLFKVCEELCLNFNEYCIEFLCYFYRMIIFTMLIPLIHEQGRYFLSSHVFINLFLQGLEVLSFKSFNNLPKLMPR